MSDTDRISNLIYTILVNEAGAVNSESDRMQFRTFRQKDGEEYRFQGSLGSGGKFRENDGNWKVDCYQEDLTTIRQLIIEQTNCALLALKMSL